MGIIQPPHDERVFSGFIITMIVIITYAVNTFIFIEKLTRNFKDPL